ncbi:hypothetical protein BCR32DRAFT_265134 [Anaeromyces robustus]|uniref:Tubby C-terminal domain-containing protein n=1 Tax=Anaeromyces robustus TaxID=1754192 RepID=A0A1Y1XK97_9FUNG|nr:hypothetical protein BCR32DRAFT_265134 [Anaeromyces robustus]|eukprot:ORX86178.1 hypothetical protein BCR32DRAFT_265134 [Anaeromyces robustus]
MLSYYTELVNKPISSPGTEILVTDNQYILLKPSINYLQEKQGVFSKPEYTIKNKDGEEIYKCKEKTKNMKNVKLISNLKDVSLLVIRDGTSSYMEICDGTNDKKIYATISTKNTIESEKYTINFYNQVSEKNETLYMNCDSTYRSCGIFYGKETDGSPLICKIIQMKSKSMFNNKTNYSIEIASGVDSLFMMGLAICLIEMKNLYQMDLMDD